MRQEAGPCCLTDGAQGQPCWLEVSPQTTPAAPAVATWWRTVCKAVCKRRTCESGIPCHLARELVRQARRLQQLQRRHLHSVQSEGVVKADRATGSSRPAQPTQRAQRRLQRRHSFLPLRARLAAMSAPNAYAMRHGGKRPRLLASGKLPARRDPLGCQLQPLPAGAPSAPAPTRLPPAPRCGQGPLPQRLASACKGARWAAQAARFRFSRVRTSLEP